VDRGAGVPQDGGQPHHVPQASPLHRLWQVAHALSMAHARSPQLTAVPAARLRTLLASERDAHRVQRELVRASLLLCPRTAR